MHGWIDTVEVKMIEYSQNAIYKFLMTETHMNAHYPSLCQYIGHDPFFDAHTVSPNTQISAGLF